MKYHMEKEINRIVKILRNDQGRDGSWNYPFETGISTDAYMIILLRTLEIHDEELIQALVERIISKQEGNGSWKLFYDEEDGNLSATVEAYYALLYSGYRQKDDKEMKAARRHILSSGGIEKSHMFTKIMLSLTGQYKWPRFFPIPVEMMLLPASFPIHFFDFSVYGRAHIAPILIVADKKFSLKTNRSPDLTDLYVSRSKAEEGDFAWSRTEEWRSLLTLVQAGIKQLAGLPSNLRLMAIKQTEKYMLNRIEADGTFLSYFSSTFLMIFALLSLGYPNTHPVITKAVNGLKSMACTINGHTHMQYTTASVWNTALIAYAMQNAGIKGKDSVIQKAIHYLLPKQHYRYGDWIVHNPYSLPGGWGFSNINSINPDVDDTTASLRAICQLVQYDPLFHQAWDRGIRWLFSMQNTDGGWPAFERNINKTFMHFLPIEGAEFLLTDPSTADLTGRTLEFFGEFTNLSKSHPAIKKGINWLMKHQEKNGSWYGRWGICYIYGTWSAITGMISTGASADHPSIQKALKWLIEIQNTDGGWGESCKSDIYKTYVPLGVSTVTQTAWALDALIAASDTPTADINRGITFLLEAAKKKDWTAAYPLGQGMAGAFYIHYHSYQYIFPLLTLSHYRKKFLEK